MSSILVLGSSGILGTEVLRTLKAEKLDCFAPSSRDLDIQDKVKVFDFVSDLKPSWIVNCAGWTNVNGAEKDFLSALNLNADAVNNIGQVAREFKSRVIHISTDYVFEGTSSIPYEEYDFTKPINAYGKSKLEGEFALKKNLEVDSFLIRTSWLYGPAGKNFAKTIIRKALKQETSSVVSDQYGTPTCATDLAVGISALIKNPVLPGIYHYSNLGQATWFDFAQKIYQLSGSNPQLVKACLTSEISQVALRPQYSVLNKTKWMSTPLPRIPEWQTSLELAMPTLIDAVRIESMQ